MEERIKISEKLSVPRVLIGLWQIADMEKDGKTLDPNVTSTSIMSFISPQQSCRNPKCNNYFILCKSRI